MWGTCLYQLKNNLIIFKYKSKCTIFNVFHLHFCIEGLSKRLKMHKNLKWIIHNFHFILWKHKSYILKWRYETNYLIFVFKTHYFYSVGPFNMRGSIFCVNLDPLSCGCPLFMDPIVEASIVTLMRINI